MNLNTIGFISITVFFAILFGVAYIYRRKNQTSNEFLGTTYTTQDTILAGHIGLVEFVILTTLGSKLGFSGFYCIGIAFILAQFLWMRDCSNTDHNTFSSFIRKRANINISIIVAIFQVFAYLALMCISISLLAKIFQSLLGWSFVNSVLGIAGFTLIYILVGGYKAIYLNQRISYAIFLVVMCITLIFIWINSNAFGLILKNLHELARLQNYPSNYYTGFNLNTKNLYLIGMLFIGIKGLKLLNNRFQQEGKVKISLFNILPKLVIIFMIVVIGITAIGTNSKGTIIEGKHIVTYQAQLPNGEIGYVVKTIDNESGANNTVSGILPPLINPKTNLIKPGVYNYLLSGVVTLQHYLPLNIKFFIVLSIIALFIASLSQYIFLSAKVVVKDIVEPLELFNKYGDDGKLWIARLTMLTMFFLSLVIAYIQLSIFDLVNYSYWFLTIFMLPLFILRLILSFTRDG